jgi:uncharacterized membrane protein
MRSVFLISASLLVISLAGTAHADFQVCSSADSNQSIFVSASYVRDGERWTDGWVMIQPGECRPVVRGDLQQREYYLYAVNVRDECILSGGHRCCIDSSNFSIRGAQDCQQRGYTEVGFRRIRTDGSPNFRYEIKAYDPLRVEPEPLPLTP